MELHTNSSNNTVFADAEGNIAYFHANLVPKRNPKFDWSEPVDGSDPATTVSRRALARRKSEHDESGDGLDAEHQQLAVLCLRCGSPKKSDYPKYMETYLENPRGMHAIRVLEREEGFHARDAA